MDHDDPEKRITELERQLAQQAGKAELERQQDEPAKYPGVSPEDVRNMAFSKPPAGKRGYNEDDVDAFLELVDKALRDATGHTLTPEQVRNMAFSKPTFGKRGYNADEVDAFLNLVEEELKRRATGANQGSQQGAFPPPPPAVLPPPDRPPTQRTGHGRRPRGGAVLVYLVWTLGSLAMMAYGGYNLWAQHSGIPARVELGRCWRASSKGSITLDCSGVWRPPDGTEQSVTVYGVPSNRGPTVDVHIHGDRAYANSLWRIGPLLGGSFLFGVLLLVVLVPEGQSRASRRSLSYRGPDFSDDPGMPPGPKHLR